MKPALVVIIFVAAAIIGACAHEPRSAAPVDHSGHAGHDQHSSPYAGQQDQEIKALSPQEIASYRKGEGMGFAKAAELNGYPGPRHVLDLKADLKLTADQEENVNKLFLQMNAEAVRLGSELVEKEKALEAVFRQKQANAELLKQQTAEISRLHGELRNAHLQAHLGMMTILSPEQIAKYNELRGYTK